MNIFLVISGIILIILTIALLMMAKRLPESAKNPNYLSALFCAVVGVIVLFIGIR